MPRSALGVQAHTLRGGSVAHPLDPDQQEYGSWNGRQGLEHIRYGLNALTPDKGLLCGRLAVRIGEIIIEMDVFCDRMGTVTTGIVDEQVGRDPSKQASIARYWGGGRFRQYTSVNLLNIIVDIFAACNAML